MSPRTKSSTVAAKVGATRDRGSQGFQHERRAGASLARFFAWALLVVPPLVVLPGLREPFRLPKLMASELFAMLALCALSLALFQIRQIDLARVARSPAILATAPLALVVVLSALLSEHREQAISATWSFGVAVAALTGFALALPRLRALLDWVFLPATVLGGISLLERFGLSEPVSGATDEGRFASVAFAGNIGDLGSYLVLPLLLGQGRLLAAATGVIESGGATPGSDRARADRPSLLRLRGGRLRWLHVAWLIGTLVWLGALVVGQVLTAVIAFLAGSAALWFLAFRGRRRFLVAALSVVAALLVITATPLRSRFVREWRDLERHGDLNDLLTGRLDGWRAGIWTGQQHPVLGAGPGSYAAEFAPAKLALLEEGVPFYLEHGRRAAFRHAHSEPIELFAELGVLGLLASAWLVAWAVRGALAAPSADRALGLALLVGLAVLSLGHFPLRSALVGYPYVVAGAWLLSLAPNLHARKATHAAAAEAPAPIASTGTPAAPATGDEPAPSSVEGLRRKRSRR